VGIAAKACRSLKTVTWFTATTHIPPICGSLINPDVPPRVTGMQGIHMIAVEFLAICFSSIYVHSLRN
jgi:hypothetical protein